MPTRIVFATLLTLALTAGAAEKPHILLIYTDDVGCGDVGCYEVKQ